MALALKRPARFASRAPRSGVRIPAWLVLTDDSVVPVTVRNVSKRGLMAECGRALEPGTWLGIDLPGFGIARAVVRWCSDGELGCQFRQPFDIERFGEVAMAGSPPSALFGGNA